MKPSVIIWDLETVPDLSGFAVANDLIGGSDAEVREAIGNKFPKHIYHSIVCIGALVAHWEPDHWAVDAIKIQISTNTDTGPVVKRNLSRDRAAMPNIIVLELRRGFPAGLRILCASVPGALPRGLLRSAALAA
jgi:hypothetical protein